MNKKEYLRRKVVAAKSLLSRYHNQREEIQRHSDSTIDDISRATDRCNKQYEKFQDAVRRWKEQSNDT